jgi:threonylcarbamoyladenosine tRNA methylthiotransferase CDKAL1
VKVVVEAYGCTMSMGEGERFKRELASLGHEVVDRADEADLAVINTCTVIQATENRMVSRIRTLSNSGKKLVVAGCLAAVQAQRIDEVAPQAVILPFSHYADFKTIMENHFGRGDGCLTPVDGGVIGILPIAQGCLGGCNYCITRIARGHLRSLHPAELLEQTEVMIQNGTKELQVTGQDTAAYGRDIGTDLSALISSLSSIPGDFRIRVGMMNPDTLTKIIDRYIPAWNNPKVFKFLHLPVQSGSNTLLESMGRRYTVQDFRGLVDSFRRSYPKMTLSTDVIVGFPGESDDDHLMTRELLESVKPDIVNITRFSPRPGTKAFSMDHKVPGWKAKERSRELTKLRFEIAEEINKPLIGKKESILVTEEGKKGSVIGRTDSYKQVVVKEELPLGEYVMVEIKEAAPTHLFGDKVLY